MVVTRNEPAVIPWGFMPSGSTYLAATVITPSRPCPNCRLGTLVSLAGAVCVGVPVGSLFGVTSLVPGFDADSIVTSA